jgi:hypothetical protein
MNTKKILKDILTGIDNESFDNGRVVCVTSFLIYYIMAIVGMGTSHPWGGMDFASGVGAMAVGFGINFRLNKGTEPPAE